MCTGLWVLEGCGGEEDAINGPAYQWPIISLQNMHMQQEHKQQQNPYQFNHLEVQMYLTLPAVSIMPSDDQQT